MPEAVAFKFCAFLSYAHADTAVAKRLHRRLEIFRIDKDLAGRLKAGGPIAKTLRPIFRDRDDFTAGHTLGEQTLAALDASAALIVLCSPASAKSHYVNEEIRLFKSRHPERPVVPVIADGKPGDPEQECFAPALRFAVAPDGTVTDVPHEELAADLRESGDGFDLAIAKVVARLLGVSTDEVFRRAERDRRRSARIRNGVIGVLALLAVMAAGSAAYAWQQLKTNEAFLEATLKRATDIVNTAVAQAERYSVPRAVTLELLVRAEGLFDDMARLGRPTPELQRQKAWMLIQFARNYAILGDTTKQRERAEEAHRLAASLSTQQRDDPATLHVLASAQNERGIVLVAEGKLDEALKAFRESVIINERLTKLVPGNATLYQALAVAHDHVGAVLAAQGRFDDALAAFRESRAIFLRYAEAEPTKLIWQRSLATTYERLGEVLFEQGKLDDAMAAYQGGLDIQHRLSKADAGNADDQRGTSVFYKKVARLLVVQGKLDEALEAYRNSVSIDDQLVKSDPSNARWQRDLSVSHIGVGDVLTKQDKFGDAHTAYRNSLAIRRRLAKFDPANKTSQRDLSIVLQRIGDAFGTEGKVSEALQAFRESFAIVDRLAKTEPGNLGWQRELAATHYRFAVAYRQSGERQRAIAAITEALAIMMRLAKLEPNHVGWRGDLAMLQNYLTEIEKQN